MGIVYLAFDGFLKRQVAIKCLRPPRADELLTWEQMVQRLVREAQAAGSLQHPNIVAIYDIVPNGNSPAIVMEYLHGRALSQLIEPGRQMNPDHTMLVLKQCASALDHAHSRNIVHRDVKPSNIMVDEAGFVRVTDFGIAKQLSSNADLTQGAAIGTLEYMSPEQLNGNVIDGSTDQYSLAVMAYQLLTGYKIFDAETIGAWCTMVLGQEPLPASERFRCSGAAWQKNRRTAIVPAASLSRTWSAPCGRGVRRVLASWQLPNLRNGNQPQQTQLWQPSPPY
jgi:serine/threonine protein kinase